MIPNTNNFQGSVESPRYNDDTNILYWFEGDAFYIEWSIDIATEHEGASHAYAPTDELVFSFFDIHKQPVHQFKFTNIGADDTVKLEFTKDVTKKFKAGTYTYCVKYYWTEEDGYERIQTVVDHGLVKVEACH